MCSLPRKSVYPSIVDASMPIGRSCKAVYRWFGPGLSEFGLSCVCVCFRCRFQHGARPRPQSSQSTGASHPRRACFKHPCQKVGSCLPMLHRQVINYMLGVLGEQWTEGHVSDTVLVGPANMGAAAGRGVRGFQIQKVGSAGRHDCYHVIITSFTINSRVASH